VNSGILTDRMTSFGSQHDQNEVLSALFSSGARVAILRVFMLDPLRAYYQRQIEAATGLAIRAIQRELERLSAIRLLYRRAEGNRTYYQVDVGFSLFPELRAMILKTADPVDRLRGLLAMEPSVVLAFLCASEGRALVVTNGGPRPNVALPESIEVEWMAVDDFAGVLAEAPERLSAYLGHGVDLLGRREHVIWRHIEAAGYAVEKGKGVP